MCSPRAAHVLSGRGQARLWPFLITRVRTSTPTRFQRGTVDSSAGFLLHCAKRGASKRQIVPFCALRDCGHVFGNSKLPGGHFGKECFESARSEDYQMARRDTACHAERVFCPSRNKNRCAGASLEPVTIKDKFAFSIQDDEGLVRVVMDV